MYNSCGNIDLELLLLCPGHRAEEKYPDLRVLRVSKCSSYDLCQADTQTDTQLLSFNNNKTDRKSHTGFRLVLTSMTLNDLERRNSLYFAFSHRIRQI